MYQRIRNLLRSTEEPLGEAVLGYKELYESHAQRETTSDAIGVGDFERIGRLELRILELAGFEESTEILDFGCGIGRLAKHVVPALGNGRYTGIDISPTMLARAAQLLEPLLCKTSHKLLVGDGGFLNTLEAQSFDMACAFSVFTHMDLEDTYLHLQCLHRVLRPQGVLVCSHLLLPESDDAKNIFNQSSVLSYHERRSRVLSVVTSREMIETVADMAGFSVKEWIGGNEELFDKEEQPLGALGQAVSILTPK